MEANTEIAVKVIINDQKVLDTVSYGPQDQVPDGPQEHVPDGPQRHVPEGPQRYVPGPMCTFEENIYPAPLMRGIDHLRNAYYNKDMAFTLEERQCLGIHGLLPPRFYTQQEQLELCHQNLERYSDDLDKYVYLRELQDRNERLFYCLVAENIQKLVPLVYTPTVGLACQKFGLIYGRPRGLFITIKDINHVFDVLRNWPMGDVRAICVTDGERILGLGDLGAYGMGIPIGKLSLYAGLARIKPHQLLPITLDVGTNTQSLLDDPLYIGLRQKRVTGQEYDDFIDEFMKAVVKRFGQRTLIQFEDFGNSNAFRLLDKYRDKYCTFNDDIQGTAAVAVAGLFAAMIVTKNRLSDNIILFQGAGGAANGISDLLVQAMMKEGTSEEDARNKIWMVDSNGLVALGRPEGVAGHKLRYAKEHAPMNNLEEIVRDIKPSVIIGAAAVPGVFTPQLLQDMASFNERPVVFALSNPTSKAECTAEAAITNTDGKVVFASGSPFDPVTYNGKTYCPGQCNNSYIFPGIALGVISAEVCYIDDDVFLIASECLSKLVSEEDLEQGRLFPPLTAIQTCSLKIAAAIAEHAYEKGIALRHPEPEDKEAAIKEGLYDCNYLSAMPPVYPWS